MRALPCRARARARAAGALLALAVCAAAAGARAEVRRFEAVGAVPMAPGTPGALRQAALQAALGEAALQAARGLVQVETGKPPPEDLAAAIGAKPEEYAVSYRVLEDRGEQAALLTGQDPTAREYVVVAEVQIDVGRLRDRLREKGRLAAVTPEAAGPARFRLELLDLPTPAAWTSIQKALAAAGATVVPLELEPRRALVEVSGVPEALALERVRGASLPPGLWAEPLGPEGEGAPARVRVHRGAPPAPPEAAAAVPGAPEGDPEAAPLDAPAAEPAPASSPN